MDANGDGKVDLNEFLAAGGTEEQFAQHDTDRSGWLENNEIEAARHQQLYNICTYVLTREGSIRKGFGSRFLPR